MVQDVVERRRPARDVLGEVVDHDHAAVLGERPEHVVGHVAGVPVERPGGRVAEDDGHGRDREGVGERGVAHVREVDEHAEPVHLADELAARLVQPAPARGVGRGVGPGVRVRVRERDVADAPPGDRAQDVGVGLERVAALEPEEHGDAALAGEPADVGGRPGDLGAVERGHLALDLVEHGRRPGRRRRPLAVVLAHEEREERGVEPALGHPREVDVGAAGLRRVALAERVPVVEHERRRVDVAVDDDGVVVDAEGVGPERVLGDEPGDGRVRERHRPARAPVGRVGRGGGRAGRGGRGRARLVGARGAGGEGEQEHGGVVPEGRRGRHRRSQGRTRGGAGVYAGGPPRPPGPERRYSIVQVSPAARSAARSPGPFCSVTAATCSFRTAS